ncbi:TPA: hypothetical protein DCE37_01765 [Candidatus Latescibacteria bacterium]|nr:hypothetical protein [Candidatus Latescibacterota bacterium]
MRVALIDTPKFVDIIRHRTPSDMHLKDIVLVLALSWTWCLALNASWQVDPLQPGDPQTFVKIANQILDEHFWGEPPDLGFRSWRAYGYPTFIAAVYAVTGREPANVVVAQYVLLGVLNLIIFAITWRLFRERSLSWIAVGLSLSYLPLYYYASVLYADFFFLILVGLATLLTITLIQRQESARIWPLGLLCGAVWTSGMLTRIVLTYFPLYAMGCVVLLYFFRHYLTPISYPRLGLKLLAIFAGAVLALAPWTIRNCTVHGKFLLNGSYGGYNVFTAHYPLARYEHWPRRIPAELWPEIDQAIAEVQANHDEVDQDRILSRMGTEIILRYPLRFVEKCAMEFLKYFTRAGAYGQGLVWYLSWAQYMVLVALAAAGWILSRDLWVRSILGIYISYFALVHSVVFAMSRLKEAIMPALLILAACGLYHLWQMATNHHGARTQITSSPLRASIQQ